MKIAMHEIVWLCVILLLVGNATSKTLQKTSQIKESFHDSIVMKRGMELVVLFVGFIFMFSVLLIAVLCRDFIFSVPI